MEKFILIILFVACAFTSMAQESYRINGKIDGIPGETLFLVCHEEGRLDTLGVARIENGVFEFTGQVSSPRAVYIITEGEKSMIPLILENTNFMVNMNNRRALVKGGEQQEIFAQFNKLNADLQQVQNAIQQAYSQAEQAGDRKKLQALNEQFNASVADARKKEEELLQKYAQSYVAAYVVAAGSKQLELEVLRQRYSLLGDTARQTTPGQAIAALIADMEKFTEGNVVPDFTVVSSTGDSLSLYPAKGKLKLIAFWESTDRSCRDENVTLLDIYQKYRLKGLEIISISRDTNMQAWEKAINTDGMFWKQGLDPNSVVFNRYHVKAIPYTLLLDEENKIIAKNLKGNDLREKVAELLKKK